MQDKRNFPRWAGHAKDHRHEDSSLGDMTENLSVGRNRSVGRASDNAKHLEFKPKDKGETPKHFQQKQNDSIHSQHIIQPTVWRLALRRLHTGGPGLSLGKALCRSLMGKST